MDNICVVVDESCVCVMSFVEGGRRKEPMHAYIHFNIYNLISKHIIINFCKFLIIHIITYIIDRMLLLSTQRTMSTFCIPIHRTRYLTPASSITSLCSKSLHRDHD